MTELHCKACDTTFYGKDYDEAGKQFMFHECELEEEEL
jgi:hypothetical protein